MGLERVDCSCLPGQGQDKVERCTKTRCTCMTSPCSESFFTKSGVSPSSVVLSYLDTASSSAPGQYSRHHLTQQPTQPTCSSSPHSSSSCSSPLQCRLPTPRMLAASPSTSRMPSLAIVTRSSRRVLGSSPTWPPSRPTLRRTASATCKLVQNGQ